MNNVREYRIEHDDKPEQKKQLRLIDSVNVKKPRKGRSDKGRPRGSHVLFKRKENYKEMKTAVYHGDTYTIIVSNKNKCTAEKCKLIDLLLTAQVSEDNLKKTKEWLKKESKIK